MFKRILVATDGSPLSQKAVDAAIGLAALSGAELLALMVTQRYPMTFFEGGLALEPAEIERMEAAWEAEAASKVDSVKTQALAKGVNCQALTVRSESVSDALISVAEKQGCDLIVMASHGYRGIKRLLLGSETQHVLTHTTVPVMVVR